MTKKLAQLSKGVKAATDGQQRAESVTAAKDKEAIDDPAEKLERERARREANIRPTSDLFSVDDTVVDHRVGMPGAASVTKK